MNKKLDAIIEVGFPLLIVGLLVAWFAVMALGGAA